MSKKKKQAIMTSKSQTESVAGYTPGDLSLSQLDTTVMGFSGKAVAEFSKEWTAVQDAKEAECKEKYGDDWQRHYVKWLCGWPDYNQATKRLNEQLYRGSLYSPMGSGAVTLRNRMLRHMKDVYGSAWERLYTHYYADPEAIELLLKWAERTGKWQELPDCLQDEYRRRVGNR